MQKGFPVKKGKPNLVRAMNKALADMIADGTYDAFVVDAEDTSEGDEPRHLLELTILSGDHKGELVSVTAFGLRRSDIDLLGLPATLTVTGGEPSVRIDD